MLDDQPPAHRFPTGAKPDLTSGQETGEPGHPFAHTFSPRAQWVRPVDGGSSGDRSAEEGDKVVEPAASQAWLGGLGA
jgi:hypothetical protein